LIADLWGVAKKHNQTEINSINQKYAVNKTLAEVSSVVCKRKRQVGIA